VIYKVIEGPSTTRHDDADLFTAFVVLLTNSSDLSGALNKANKTSFWRSFLSLSCPGGSTPFVDETLFPFLYECKQRFRKDQEEKV
jgi:hypothetical protein